MGHVIIPVVIFIGLGVLTSGLLALASKIFEVKKNETEEMIKEALPGANCGGCGYSGCAALAEAIAKGEAKVNACTVGGEDVAKQVAEIMGVTAEKAARMRANTPAKSISMRACPTVPRLQE